MKLTRRVSLLLVFTGVVSGALALRGRVARAQIDPIRVSYGLYESRPGLPAALLGEIYREDTNPTTYTEHWVLYPGYVNPSGTNGVTLVIRPGLREYRDSRDFFARVPFARGSRYVRVACLDSADRPTVR